MKISLATVHKLRMSGSAMFTILPGRAPRTSRSLAMTASTSTPSPDGPAEEAADEISPELIGGWVGLLATMASLVWPVIGIV